MATLFQKIIGKRVLIQKDPDLETTQGGLIVPIAATRELLDKGTIIQVADGVHSNLQTGVRVSFERGAGTQVGEDKNLLLLNHMEILGVF